MSDIDYELMTDLVFAFDMLEREHGWDLSSGEIAKMLEVFYPAFKAHLPETIGELEAVFERAYVNTWGSDHTCDKTTEAEMRAFMVDALPVGEWHKRWKGER